jgi:hypothetical protein
MIRGALTLLATTFLINSPYFRLSSGDWRFRWVKNPFAVPPGFEVPNEHADLGLNPGRTDWE